MNDLLTDEEVAELTKAKRHKEQKVVLRKAGIFFVERLDGSPGVCWYHVHNPNDSIRLENNDEPNFAAIEL